MRVEGFGRISALRSAKSAASSKPGATPRVMCTDDSSPEGATHRAGLRNESPLQGSARSCVVTQGVAPGFDEAAPLALRKTGMFSQPATRQQDAGAYTNKSCCSLTQMNISRSCPCLRTSSTGSSWSTLVAIPTRKIRKISIGSHLRSSFVRDNGADSS